jgi:hypothetical protein
MKIKLVLSLQEILIYQTRHQIIPKNFKNKNHFNKSLQNKIILLNNNINYNNLGLFKFL